MVGGVQVMVLQALILHRMMSFFPQFQRNLLPPLAGSRGCVNYVGKL